MAGLAWKMFSNTKLYPECRSGQHIVVVQFIGGRAAGFYTVKSPAYLLSGFWVDVFHDYDIFKWKKVLDKLMIIIGQNKA